MKKHIDDEILVVRKEQEEERANSEATEDKPLKSKEGRFTHVSLTPQKGAN